MLRRKAKWTIDNLSDSSMSISIKSKKKYKYYTQKDMVK